MIPCSGKKVLVRVDFNVPLNDTFQVSDDTRIRAAIPTIQHIIGDGGAVILMSHLGRPQKKKQEDGSIDVKRFTLEHIVTKISELLDIKVAFCPETVGKIASKMVADLQMGEVLLLENTRFEEGEKTGSEDLAKKMAALGEAFVNDAFGTAHRAHASTAIIAHFFDKKAKSFGFLMEKEIKAANKILHNPAHPLTAIVGGAKVSDKILLLDRLLDTVDNLIIGGGMAFTFDKALGGKIGNSLCEEDKIELAASLLKKAKAKGVNIYLPTDNKIADNFSNDANTQLVKAGEIPDGWMGLDIGPDSIASFATAILSSKTILWNGPMGVFEFENFAEGTQSIATFVARATKNGAYSLIGGGDSVAAINQAGLADQVSHVSTGGGAMLEYLEGKVLPGIAGIKQ